MTNQSNFLSIHEMNQFLQKKQEEQEEENEKSNLAKYNQTKKIQNK